MNKFFAEVKDGWPKPATRRDRIISVVFGGLGATLIGMTVRIVAGPLPLPAWGLARWAVSCAATGAALGLAVPKSTILAFYPFVKLFGAILDGM